jgi:hypothetical protein
MSEHTGWPALVRKLYATLNHQDWREFARFCRSIKGRYSGDFSTSRLSKSELETLSRYADRAR